MCVCDCVFVAVTVAAVFLWLCVCVCVCMLVVVCLWSRVVAVVVCCDVLCVFRSGSDLALAAEVRRSGCACDLALAVGHCKLPTAS